MAIQKRRDTQTTRARRRPPTGRINRALKWKVKTAAELIDDLPNGDFNDKMVVIIAKIAVRTPKHREEEEINRLIETLTPKLRESSTSDVEFKRRCKKHIGDGGKNVRRLWYGTEKFKKLDS